MNDRVVEADYVIVGAGAVAMAFADSLLSESDATMILVDRRHKPGGHWNDAYSFVRLHSPSMYYGVNSRALGGDRIEQVGFNRGLLELATGSEICAYFDQVMRHRFLPSGRVTYLPMCEFGQDAVATSRVSGARTRLHARKKFVDATYADTRLPSTHPPSFSVSSDAICIPPNSLPRLKQPCAGFVIIGAGKTAMDVAIWLLEHNMDPDRIVWIRPRDTWLYNRKYYQPHFDLFADTVGGLAAEMEAVRDAESLEDLFRRLESAKALFRIDPAATPTMFRCATVSEAELELMRRIGNVVRLGHVKAIESKRITLDRGSIPTSTQHVHINCSADGIPKKPVQPIFQDGRIVLQYVSHCWPTFSGAFVAYLEATRSDNAERNLLAAPVPMAEEPLDWLRLRVLEGRNEARWAEHADVQAWLENARLDSFSGMFARAEREPTPENTALCERYFQARQAGMMRLANLLPDATDRSPN